MVAKEFKIKSEQVCCQEQTRSEIEVAHFRYFVSERRGRGSLTRNRRNVNLHFEKKKTFSRLGPWDYSPRCNLIFAEVGFRVRHGTP